MHMDIVYEVLHPFHLWAWIAAACALALAAATTSILAFSQRFSPRWWQGVGILTLCLLAVAFGAHSRGMTYELREAVVACYKPPISTGCDMRKSQVVVAKQLIDTLGVPLVIATILSLAATAFLLRQQLTAERPHPPAPVVGLFIGVIATGCGAFLTTNGVTSWIQTAYLADITRAGDALGQIPLYEAIITTIFGVVVLLAGFAGIIGFSIPRHNTATASPQTTTQVYPPPPDQPYGERASNALDVFPASRETRFSSFCQAFSFHSAPRKESAADQSASAYPTLFAATTASRYSSKKFHSAEAAADGWLPARRAIYQ